MTARVMSERPLPQPSVRDQRRFAAIVAVDVAGYSRLITAIKGWIRPTANLAGYAPLFDALRLAGVPE